MAVVVQGTWYLPTTELAIPLKPGLIYVNPVSQGLQDELLIASK